jgi:hypothetical protein
MTKSIVVFPDTNFFLECMVPEECPWTDVVDADVVNLLVCRGVRRELDDQKRSARGRRQERARKLSSQLRSSDQAREPLVLRDSGPRMTLAAAPIVRRLPAYPPELQGDHPDDRIVCDILDHIEAVPEAAPIFLTDDGHAAATAAHVGICVIHVPDGGDDAKPSWRLPPEPNPLQKRVADLERQVSGLAMSGPRIGISFLDSNGAEVEAVEFRYTRLPPLGPGDALEILHRLESLFPPDVPPETPTQLPGSPHLTRLDNHFGRLGNLERFGLPAGAVSAYRTKRAEWLDGVSATLWDIHESLMPAVSLCHVSVRLANLGRQPAVSLLATVEGVGDLDLCRVGDMTDVPSEPSFKPPAPPRLNVFGAGGPSFPTLLDLLRNHHRPVPVREPHLFYWGQGSREVFSTMSAECGEFLHGLDHELRLRMLPGRAAITRGSAALRCTVRAANIPEPVTATLPCTFASEDGDTMKLVIGLLDRLATDPS